MSGGGDDFGDLAPVDPGISADQNAEREAAGLAFGLDLSSAQAVAELNSIGRRDALDDLLSRTVRYFIILAAILVGLAAVVLVYHYISPADWLFLTEVRVERLKDFLFSGTVGAALTQLARSKLGKAETSK